MTLGSAQPGPAGARPLRCPRCGTTLPAGSSFCNECGAPQPAAATAEPESVPADDTALYPLIARANLHRLRGQLAEARALCREALRRSPDNAAARYLIADTYQAEGQVEEATRWYLEALELSPDPRTLPPGVAPPPVIGGEIAWPRAPGRERRRLTWPRVLSLALPPAVAALLVLTIVLAEEPPPREIDAPPVRWTARRDPPSAPPPSLSPVEAALWQTAASVAATDVTGAQLAGLSLAPFGDEARVRLLLPRSVAFPQDRLLRLGLRVAHALATASDSVSRYRLEWFQTAPTGGMEPVLVADLTRAAALGSPEVVSGQSLANLFTDIRPRANE